MQPVNHVCTVSTRDGESFSGRLANWFPPLRFQLWKSYTDSGISTELQSRLSAEQCATSESVSTPLDLRWVSLICKKNEAGGFCRSESPSPSADVSVDAVHAGVLSFSYLAACFIAARKLKSQTE